MRHASQQALDELAPLLAELRLMPALAEKRPGVFYLKSKAVLHFHEDAEGLFADLRLPGDDWQRLAVSRVRDQRTVVTLLKRSLGKDA